MKKTLPVSIFLLMVLTGLPSLAQNPAVTSALQAKYGSAQWHTECRGWYLVSYNKNGTNFYAFADPSGNVIASDAVKYKIHKGFIEMEIFDQLKKNDHDNWERDMHQYERDYNTYLSKKNAYKNALSAYNTSVEAAKKEAEARWQNARQQAYNNAVAKAKAQAQQAQSQVNSNTSILGAILIGAASGINIGLAGENAAKQVQYQPFEDRVMAERNLLTPPAEPYNPMPTKPSEPSNGYEWRTYPLLQPCPYTKLDYSAISEPDGHSMALKDGQWWGIVDASLNEVIPCRYSGVSACGDLYSVCRDGKYGLMDLKGRKYAQEIYSSIKYENGMFIVGDSGKYGLLSPTGTVIMPCEYENIESSNGYMMCRKGGLWGVYTKDYEELYPCQFQEEEFIKTGNDLLLRTKVKGLWGLVDFSSGTSLLPNNFSRIEPFKIGTSPAFKVYQEGRQGVYYANGVLLLPCEFSSISTTKVGTQNCIEVRKDGHVGLYDMDGAVIITPDRYTSYTYKGDFFEVSTSNSRKGICSLYGEELIPAEYNSLKFDRDLYGFIACKDGKWGIVDIKGQPSFPMVEASDVEFLSSMPDVMVINNGPKGYGAVSEDGAQIVAPKFKSSQMIGKVFAAKKKNPAIARTHQEKKNARYNLYDDYMTSQSVEKNRRGTFSFYAQNYVERIINDWQKRGEFEKVSDWQARVNDNTRQQKVYALTKAAQDNYIAMNAKKMPKDSPSITGRYDPDNETYQIHTAYSDAPIFIHVPTIDAEEFKSSFTSLKRSADFQVKDDGIALATYTFSMPNGNTYKYQGQDHLQYAVAQVDYNFDDIDLGNLAGKFSTSTMKFGTSDVDKNIPVTDQVRDKTFAVIIANENYLKEKDVEFAYNDGMAFKDYCVKAMGIPSANVHFKPNAGLNDMRFEFNWIKKVAEDYNGEAEFVIYYAGHGVPDDASREAYLLPVDGNGEDLESAYKLSKLYNMLGEIPSKDVLVFMDACFSGSQRSGEVLASARGVAIRPEIAAPTGNVVIYSAVTDKETAFPYKDKVHGLFTYYLLKKLQSTEGSLDMGTLTDYVSEEVARKSIVVNNKSQHPTVSAAPAVVSSWRSLSVK